MQMQVDEIKINRKIKCEHQKLWHIPLMKVKMHLTWFCITWEAVLYRSRMSLLGSPEKVIENIYK